MEDVMGRRYSSLVSHLGRMVVIGGIGVSSILTVGDGLDTPLSVLAALMAGVVTLAFLFHPRNTDLALAVVAVTLSLGLAVPDIREFVGVILPVLYASYVAAAYSRAELRFLWLAWLLLATAVTIMGGLSFVNTAALSVSPWVAKSIATISLWSVVGFMWMLGEQVRRRRADLATLQERADLAALVERTRIAREMHDIVAHSLTSVIALADGARYAATSQPALAVQALETISQTSREALGDMRGLLSVLRDDAGRDLLAPPTLRDIQGLLADARRSGLDLTAQGIETLPDDLPPLLQFSLYRLIQELLTNMLKHSSQRAGTLTVRTTDGKIVLEAQNAAGAETRAGKGFGLLGMKERVNALSGRMSTRREADNFSVMVELPR
ncbi:sensor histidine kinase [Deinococcus radiopugnans]|nr:histidine kinase [Deinococcus radiopugnans]MBB6015977.1 signal transduction histidine kinase [Deinococcus radiopugnans ATCC 19172]